MSDKQEIEFVNGLTVKAPRDGAPDFVKASLSIKRVDLIEWLQARDDEWINADVKEAKSGKWYASVNAWKPQSSDAPRQQHQGSPQSQSYTPENNKFFNDDDIPF